MRRPPPISDYEGLGLLLQSAGVETSRVEELVRGFLDRQADKKLARLNAYELQMLRDSVNNGLEVIRNDQDSALRAIGLTLSIFRGEANAYQRAFVASTRLTNALVGLVILLQILLLLLGGCLLFAAG